SKLVPSIDAAEKELAKASYDLIFLDYQMPSGTGMEFLKRNAEKVQETPVVMLTGQGAEEVAVEAMKLGAYDYLNKSSLSLDLVPIVINNVYERLVARKAKQQLEAEHHEREKQDAAIMIFQSTVRGFAHHINNALANIVLRLHSRKRKTAKQKSLSTEEAEELFSQIEISSLVIEEVVAALVKLNSELANKIDIEKRLGEIKEELEDKIRSLEGKKKADGGTKSRRS
ncbi:MAG: response regulator, partial [Bacteroidota bacterium]